jgi:hypothetical protein
MKYNRTRTAISAGALSIVPFLSKAQSDNPHRWTERLEAGYSFCLASATFRNSLSAPGENGLPAIDTSVMTKVKPKGGFGAFVGTYFPIAKMGEQGRLAISTSFLYNAIMWEKGGFSVESNSQTGTTSTGSGTIEMALPVGVEYKYGCDGLQDKSKRFCYSVGMGVYPSMMLTTYHGTNDGKTRMLPYLKGEAGIFAGICFKVRAIYTFGNLKYIDYTETSGNMQSITSLTGKSSLTLSLVLMPMSWKWEKVDWWR